mmetsp:Transcript_20148/g.36215  ORF Transcript_20148/g.36215 Transcript_20148/m.36215 type:complete len:196 (+) Transcript_20148:106-693(+)
MGSLPSSDGSIASDRSFADADWKSISENFSVISINSSMLIDVDTFAYKEILLKPFLGSEEPKPDSQTPSRKTTLNYKVESRKGESNYDFAYCHDPFYPSIESSHTESVARHGKKQSGHTLRRLPTRKYPGLLSEYSCSECTTSASSKVMDKEYPSNANIHGKYRGHKRNKQWRRRQRRHEKHRLRKELKESLIRN